MRNFDYDKIFGEVEAELTRRMENSLPLFEEDDILDLRLTYDRYGHLANVHIYGDCNGTPIALDFEEGLMIYYPTPYEKDREKYCPLPDLLDYLMDEYEGYLVRP